MLRLVLWGLHQGLRKFVEGLSVLFVFEEDGRFLLRLQGGFL